MPRLSTDKPQYSGSCCAAVARVASCCVALWDLTQPVPSCFRLRSSPLSSVCSASKVSGLSSHTLARNTMRSSCAIKMSSTQAMHQHRRRGAAQQHKHTSTRNTIRSTCSETLPANQYDPSTTDAQQHTWPRRSSIPAADITATLHYSRQLKSTDMLPALPAVRRPPARQAQPALYSIAVLPESFCNWQSTFTGDRSQHTHDAGRSSP